MSVFRSVLVSSSMMISPGAPAMFERTETLDRSQQNSFNTNNQQSYKREDDESQDGLQFELLKGDNPDIYGAQLVGSFLHKMHRGRD